jgi:small nuclear ribonucleoprotein D2
MQYDVGDTRTKMAQPPLKQARTEADVIGFSKSDSATYKSGPFSLLYNAVHDPKGYILVQCRNDRKIVAKLIAFDHHFNLVLTNAMEIWTKTTKTGEMEHGTRHIGKMLLRGDGVTLITRVPDDDSA